MYFKDLTKYKYTDKEDSLNIGWLEKGHMINKGDVPEEFIEKLWKYLRYPVNVCRGFHVCSLCKNIKKGVPVVTYKDEKRQAGYYEIRVWGKNGKVYAAPSLIIHYILQHGYRPPQEFIDAVMDSEDASSDEYYQKVLDYSNGYGFWLEDDHTKVNSNEEAYNSNYNDVPIKIKDNFKSYLLLFLLGILAGILCRLSDFFPYESLWSLSSIATLFGFWIASVGVITCLSSSNIGAFINSFLYMSGMTISFYVLKYILGFYNQRFDNDGKFQTDLFIIYLVLSVACGIGSFILYYWNKGNIFSSFLYALPASGMAAEAAGCLFILVNKHMLLGQTLFDFLFALLFGVILFKKADNKILYILSAVIVTILVFWIVYKPFLLSV